MLGQQLAPSPVDERDFNLSLAQAQTKQSSGALAPLRVALKDRPKLQRAGSLRLARNADPLPHWPHPSVLH